MATRVIGLAGRPGCGKSAVARALAERAGVEVIDLDRVAWETYAPETPAYDRLVKRFGRTILSCDGRVDRGRLGDLGLSDAAARGDLEAIVHPAVNERLADHVLDARRRNVEILLVEGALLASSPHVDRSIFDRLLWLEASDETRRERLRKDDREEHVDRLSGAVPGAATVVDAEGTISQVADRVWRLADQ